MKVDHYSELTIWRGALVCCQRHFTSLSVPSKAQNVATPLFFKVLIQNKQRKKTERIPEILVARENRYKNGGSKS